MEKHKSKYKAPKDFEKSQKPKTRKDLKDYTHDDKNGGLNPHSTGEIQDLVPRKTDKLVIDDVKNMVPEIKHRVYQDVKTGKYSPKEAKKIFKKLQIEDTEGYLDKLENIDHGVIVNSLEEHINRLSSKQKDDVLRKYIRIKIVEAVKKQYLVEQPKQPTAAVTAVDSDKESPDAEQTSNTTTDTTTAATPPTTDTAATPPTTNTAAASTTATSDSSSDKKTSSDTEIEKPEEQSPEEQAAQQLAKRKQVSKEFYAVVQASKTNDKLEKYIDTALQPLIASMTGISDEKFNLTRAAAIRKLRSVSNIPKKVQKS